MLLGGTARERDTELTSIAQILPLCHDWSDNLDAFFTLSRKLEFISCQKRILWDYLLKDILTELHQHFLFELVHVRCFEFVSVASLHKRCYWNKQKNLQCWFDSCRFAWRSYGFNGRRYDYSIAPSCVRTVQLPLQLTLAPEHRLAYILKFPF